MAFSGKTHPITSWTAEERVTSWKLARPVRLGTLLVGAATMLGGCATYSPDGGLGVTREIASRELRQDVVRVREPADSDRVKSRVTALLRSPLTVDTAVQIALLNNRGLQAAYNDLGISEALFVQTGLSLFIVTAPRTTEVVAVRDRVIAPQDDDAVFARHNRCVSRTLGEVTPEQQAGCPTSRGLPVSCAHRPSPLEG